MITVCADAIYLYVGVCVAFSGYVTQLYVLEMSFGNEFQAFYRYKTLGVIGDPR